MKPHKVFQSEADPSSLNWIERILIWLAGADPHCLAQCPKWEKVKYAAFGASVLVPVAFGMIGSAYAVSTLTESLLIIVGFCLVWGFIILTIDRVLLATYRAYAGKAKKVTQFVIRITVAVLMGLTVSHPLTLLLFKDTIASEVEKSRGKEIAKIRLESDQAKEVIDQRLIKASANLELLQKKYEDTISGNFVTNSSGTAPTAATTVNAATGKDQRFADIDAQLSELKDEREAVRKDLDYWQKTYDEEISGARTGRPGVGPQARAIESDQLVWRREEMRRLGTAIAGLSQKRVKISSELIEKSATANAEIASQKRNLEKQKLAMFTSQQGQMVGLVKDQIESASAEIEVLRGEAKQLSIDTADRIASLKTETRADIMTQTIVLHHIFEDPKNGGSFAFAVYVVIASLFTLIDTLPLVVKFFSVSGPYDMLQHMESKKYAPFHDLNVFGDPKAFEQQHAAFRKQMESRIDLYREVEDYWTDHVENSKPKVPKQQPVANKDSSTNPKQTQRATAQVKNKAVRKASVKRGKSQPKITAQVHQSSPQSKKRQPSQPVVRQPVQQFAPQPRKQASDQVRKALQQRQRQQNVLKSIARNPVQQPAQSVARKPVSKQLQNRPRPIKTEPSQQVRNPQPNVEKKPKPMPSKKKSDLQKLREQRVAQMNQGTAANQVRPQVQTKRVQKAKPTVARIPINRSPRNMTPAKQANEQNPNDDILVS